jgi:D-beta-D-heptose 7-phosphate kinase/D-beta-D-heptose 1-phosphate adenosyltransferase
MTLLVVVGDVLLDRDVRGSAERLSPDGPVPVVDATSRRSRPGGAGLAALLARRVADRVTLVAPFGADEAGRELQRLLEAGGVELVVCPSDEATGTKSRVRADGHTVCRIDEGGAMTRPSGLPAAAGAAVEDADGVLVADYGRGFTSDHRVRALIAANVRRRPVVWDPHHQGAAPVPGVRLATPNASEACRLSGVSSTPAGLARFAAAGTALLRTWAPAAVAVTLGERGAMLVEGPGPPLLVPVPGVPGADTCGAGDCLAAAAAAALADGAVTSEAVVAGVEAAGAYVAAGGASGLQDPPASIPTEGVDALVGAVRRRGGTVVAAGGCFDLLHVGHVRLLESARSLGDLLVVCLNGDGSVRRLKGPGRPVVPATDRAAVVQSLGCVDAVVIFEEDSPVEVLRRLRPDVFVKGGDYAHRALPEIHELASWGGQVVAVPYLPGRSTTRMIEEATSVVG